MLASAQQLLHPSPDVLGVSTNARNQLERELLVHEELGLLSFFYFSAVEVCRLYVWPIEFRQLLDLGSELRIE